MVMADKKGARHTKGFREVFVNLEGEDWVDEENVAKEVNLVMGKEVNGGPRKNMDVFRKDKGRKRINVEAKGGKVRINSSGAGNNEDRVFEGDNNENVGMDNEDVTEVNKDKGRVRGSHRLKSGINFESVPVNRKEGTGEGEGINVEVEGKKVSVEDSKDGVGEDKLLDQKDVEDIEMVDDEDLVGVDEDGNSVSGDENVDRMVNNDRGMMREEVIKKVNVGDKERSGRKDKGGKSVGDVGVRVRSGRAGKKTNRSNIRKGPRIKMLSWSFVPKSIRSDFYVPRVTRLNFAHREMSITRQKGFLVSHIDLESFRRILRDDPSRAPSIFPRVPDWWPRDWGKIPITLPRELGYYRHILLGNGAAPASVSTWKAAYALLCNQLALGWVLDYQSSGYDRTRVGKTTNKIAKDMLSYGSFYFVEHGYQRTLKEFMSAHNIPMSDYVSDLEMGRRHDHINRMYQGIFGGDCRTHVCPSTIACEEGKEMWRKFDIFKDLEGLYEYSPAVLGAAYLAAARVAEDHEELLNGLLKDGLLSNHVSHKVDEHAQEKGFYVSLSSRVKGFLTDEELSKYERRT